MGKLTRKDFIKFALGLAQIDDDVVRKDAVDSNIKILRETNPAFDESRFREFIRKKVKKRRWIAPKTAVRFLYPRERV